MKQKQYKCLELVIIGLLIISLFLPWIHVYGMGGTTWFDYHLMPTTIYDEAISFWQGALHSTLDVNRPFVVYFMVDLALCAIIPYVTLVLLFVSSILVGTTGLSEQRADRSRRLLKWAKGCLFIEVLLIVTSHVVYSICQSNMFRLFWGIPIAIVLMFFEGIIRKKWILHVGIEYRKQERTK